jgi:hypothetical protein
MKKKRLSNIIIQIELCIGVSPQKRRKNKSKNKVEK